MVSEVKAFYVYEYRDPLTGIPFYVGKGIGDRWKQHIGRTHNVIMRSKLEKLKVAGLEPCIIKVHEGLTEQDALDKEAVLISKYGRIIEGGSLCNFSLGGQGNLKYDYGKVIDRLGKVTDDILSKEVGCTRSALSYIRRGLGIQACPDKPNYSPPPPMGGWNRIELPDECISQLGKMPDKKLGELYGVSKYTIQYRRHELGIESYSKTTGNDGKFKKGSTLSPRTDTRLYHFFHKDGRGFVGQKSLFAEYLSVHKSRTADLVSGRAKSLLGWRLEGEVQI